MNTKYKGKTMENILDLVFENRRDNLSKIIDLYTLLLSIKIIDVVDDVTNIQQDLNYEVLSEKITEKPTYYIEMLKIRLSEVYSKFGLVIEGGYLENYIIIPKLINDLESMEKDNLDFIENLLVDDSNVMDRFLKLLDELYPSENNISHLEYIDVSDYFFENIVLPIYTVKEEMGNVINTTLVNVLVKLLVINKNVKNTIIFKDILAGSVTISLDINTEFDLVKDIIESNIKTNMVKGIDIDSIILDIFITLYIFKENTDLSYYINSAKFDNVFNALGDVSNVKNVLNSLLQQVGE